MRVVALVSFVATAAATYEVQPGDTVSGLAVELGTSVAELVELNHLDNPDLIVIGQVLRTPADGKASGIDLAPRIPGTHLVQPGETLARVAAAYDIDPETVALANGLGERGLIAGTRIRLTPLPVPFHPRPNHAHRVAAGETLSHIAISHDTTVAQIVAENGIADPDRILVGQALRIGSGWICPVRGASFSRTWGLIKPDGRTHRGVDLFARRGAAIVAPVSGHVHLSKGPVGGMQFTLYGDDGFVYFGSHLDSFGRSGDVEAGAVIGTVGNSGNAAGTSAHLHFQVHPPGTTDTANPYPILLETCR